MLNSFDSFKFFFSRCVAFRCSVRCGGSGPLPVPVADFFFGRFRSLLFFTELRIRSVAENSSHSSRRSFSAARSRSPSLNANLFASSFVLSIPVSDSVVCFFFSSFYYSSVLLSSGRPVSFGSFVLFSAFAALILTLCTANVETIRLCGISNRTPNEANCNQPIEFVYANGNIRRAENRSRVFLLLQFSLIEVLFWLVSRSFAGAAKFIFSLLRL